MFSTVVKSCNESHVNSCLHWEPKLSENDVKQGGPSCALSIPQLGRGGGSNDWCSANIFLYRS